MRYGVIISALLHIGVLILVIAGLPSLLNSERQEIVPIAVEVVSPDELQKAPPPKPAPKPAAKPQPPKPEPPKAAKPAPPPPPAPAPPPEQVVKIPEPEPMPAEKPKPPPPPEKKPEPPKPAPKPEAKPEPPKPPEKKPEPKQVAAAEPDAPAPRPKRKPSPPPDEFQSLLKNLEKEKEKKERQEEQQKKAPEPPKQAAVQPAPQTPRRSALQERMIAASLAQAIRQQLAPCWSIPAGAKDAADMSVAIRLRLNPDGALGGQPRIEDTARLNRDLSFRTVAESALRALRNPNCMPLKLPYDQYDVWREILFVFDPREALGQ